MTGVVGNRMIVLKLSTLVVGRNITTFFLQRNCAGWRQNSIKT